MIRVLFDSHDLEQVIQGLHDAVLHHAHRRVDARHAGDMEAWSHHDRRMAEYQLQAWFLERRKGPPPCNCVASGGGACDTCTPLCTRGHQGCVATHGAVCRRDP